MTLDISKWAEVCEAVSELDEPPIRRCPNCGALGYEVVKGSVSCSAGCVSSYAGESGPWVILRDRQVP
jgi:hypothetical protein